MAIGRSLKCAGNLKFGCRRVPVSDYMRAIERKTARHVYHNTPLPGVAWPGSVMVRALDSRVTELAR